jgi:hypothetical protein
LLSDVIYKEVTGTSHLRFGIVGIGGTRFCGCPGDAAFDLEPGVTAVPGWQVWDL